MAWDPWKDGRTKVYASAGRSSYGLPTFAAILSFARITGARVWNFDPVSLVQDPNVYRHSKSLVNESSTVSAMDDGVKASYQDQLTIGIERALSAGVTVGLRGDYLRLGRALEDRCDLDYTQPETGFNQCALINPGSSGKFASGNIPTCDYLNDAPEGNRCYPTGAATPPARRLYRGIELFARQSLGDRLWLQANYAYSSLRGNYDGGVIEGIYDQTLGNTRPSVNYDFGTPAFWHNGYGALTLDRPHRFRFDGSWVTPLRLAVGLQAFVESGAPLNRLGYHSLAGGPAVFLDPRGSAGRLPTLWDANLVLSYPIPIGPATANLEGYLYNVFNNQIPTARDQGWTSSPPPGWAGNIYDPNQPQNNPDYGKVTSRSAPRSFRAALRLSF